MLLLKSVLPVFVNSLPKDHYAQRTGQNFQERGINFFPTRLQRENAMIIINVTFRHVLPTRLRRANAVIIIINVTIRYVLPTRLQRENAMIIINVTFRYVLPTRLQRANAVIIIKCNRQVYSTHEVTESKCSDYYYRCNHQVCSTHEVTKRKLNDYY